METHSSSEVVDTSPARSASTQAQLLIRSMEISGPPTRRRELTLEEFELIDLRFERAQALLKLESLFAEGLFNC